MRILARLVCLVTAFSTLAFGGVSFRSLPSIPDGISRPEALAVKPLSVEFQRRLTFRDMKLVDLMAGKSSLVLAGSRRVYQSGHPDLPFVQHRFEVPAGQSARAVLSNVVLEESEEAVSLPNLKDYVWSSIQHELDFAVRNTGRFYPGKFVNSVMDGNEVLVNIFPAQVDLQTGKMMVMREADLRLEYRPAALRIQIPQGGDNSESVIITHPSMLKAAKLLQLYHASEFFTDSVIVTVDEIAKKMAPVSEDTLPDGYKSRDDADFVIHKYDPKTKKGYQYDLARKTIAYLREKQANGKLRYVTLLGDSEHVPPSYYFSVPGAYGPRFGPTDMCYGALKKCMDPKVSVGRLPFNSLSQVKVYLAKLGRWTTYAKDADSEMALYGGKAFRGLHYIGEMGSLRLLENANTDWRGVKKYFQTQGTYNRHGVMDLVSGKRKSSFVYYLDHGTGNQLWINSAHVSSTDVKNAKVDYSGTNPFITSISCTNAAFDKPLMISRIFGDAKHGNVSVGVAMLRSPMGAVAYVGSARPGIGSPTYRVDTSGNLTITGATYGLQLLDTFYQNYHNALGGRVGDLLLKTLRGYVHGMGNDLTASRHVWTYFNYAFLGDPVVRLPHRRRVEDGFKRALSLASFDSGFGIPELNLDALTEPFALKLESAVATTANLVKVDQYTGSVTPVGKAVSLHAGEDKVMFDGSASDASGTYLLTVENNKGVPRERRVWFQAR